MKYIFSVILNFLLINTFAQVVETPKTNIRINSDSLSRLTLYDTDYLTKGFHKEKRDELRALMPDSSVIVVFANALKVRSNDVDFEYHQNPNFLYLTGFREPDAVLLIFKEVRDFDSVKTNEIIFVPERNPSREVWTGKMVGTKSVMKNYGLSVAYSNLDFANLNIDFGKFNKVMYSPMNEKFMDEYSEKGSTNALMKSFKARQKAYLTNFDDRFFDEMMARLRQVKTKDEMRLLTNAIDITCKGFMEMIKSVEPGIAEYQTEAMVEYFFKANGAEFEGYPSICGAAENSTTLHYSSNRRKLLGTEVLVVDAGAEYHGYSADVTRTIPVGGKYSEEQKIIYNIVLDAQKAGIDACKAGNSFWAPHKAAVAVVQKRLFELGIIKSESDFRKYFMHGTSHYLGLDVHDPGLYDNLANGNVITVEPGIYIPEGADCDKKWWNIGIRIEDDVLIMDATPKVLSDCIPKTVEAIEALMAQKGFFNK